jgi:two-component sensor histidine kinase/predicted hydrocarbon binding protein
LENIKDLKSKIRKLEEENALLKNERANYFTADKTVKYPNAFKNIFEDAEKVVGEYFEGFSTDPSKGVIEINDERYVLLRASSLSVGFLNIIKDLYSDKGEQEAFQIGKNLLFDIAHVIGLEDAKKFHGSMGLKDPISKMAAGPVHFAYTGWANVEILPESNPTPDDNYFLKYRHPSSFEADSWIKSGVKSEFPVCIMNSGYSSGWCEESFGNPLTAVEITCRAKGDEHCTFIMAPPHKIDQYIKTEGLIMENEPYDVPLFFERKKIEEKIKQSLEEKNVLLKEVHHRVKNNLQIISSLLNLQSNYFKDEASKSLFRESQNRIKTLALVHEKLYNSSDVQYVDLAEYIASITNLLSYSFDKEFIDVVFDMDIEGLKKFDIEGAIPCGLIVNEVLSNSFKYAFPNKLSGEIKISFKEIDKGYEMLISDNGVGIPKNIDVSNSNSLGLELIHSLVDQLDGKVNVLLEKGTAYRIAFPYH